MPRYVTPILITLAAPLAGCLGESCDDSWLWRQDRINDVRQCAKDGHRQSQLQYGKLLALSGQSTESAVWLERAIKGKGADGSFQVAKAFDGAFGDQRLAEEWYRKALGQGSWEAAKELGLKRHQDGNPAEAQRLFERAVDLGGGWAANSIGFRLEHQREDPAAAVTWYRRGAQLGDVSSMRDYARVLKNGTGVKVDLAEAFRWARRTAEHEKADGYDLFNLAKMYDEGVGTPRNPEAALATLRLAKSKRVDDSDSRTPKKIESMQLRLERQLDASTAQRRSAVK
jgi:TPR repeat protein